MVEWLDRLCIPLKDIPDQSGLEKPGLHFTHLYSRMLAKWSFKNYTFGKAKKLFQQIRADSRFKVNNSSTDFCVTIWGCVDTVQVFVYLNEVT